jgi:ribosomal protein S12 methylthiotransferase accessory factor
VAALAGLAADPGSFWEDLRIGELKTLLALAIGNGDAIREGCDWIHHFAQIHPERYRVYRCIEALLKLEDEGLDEDCRTAVQDLYGSATLRMAEAHLARSTRFFNIPAPGAALEGFDMHERLLDAYAKVHRLKAAH